MSVESDAGHVLALPAGKRIDQFKIEWVLGQGGFGIVYLGRDERLDRAVAIKEYLPDALATRVAGATVTPTSPRNKDAYVQGLRSFVEEARVLAALDHPGIVKVLTVAEANDTAYLVMPYYAGETLKERCARDPRPWSQEQVEGLLQPLLDALELVHARGLLHRDIAPDNIYLRQDGRPLLIDFGAARRVVGEISHSLTMMVKTGYSPYEQYQGMAREEFGPWSDIYSLAAVVYELASGEKVYPATDRILNDVMPTLQARRPAGYTPRFMAAIDEALSVRPKQRPQSIAEWRARFDGSRPDKVTSGSSGGGPDKATSGSSGGGPGGGKRDRRGVWMAFGLIALVGAGIGGIWLWLGAEVKTFEQQAADPRAQEQRLEEDRRRAEAERREQAERKEAVPAKAEQQAADALVREQRLEEDRRRAEARRREDAEREAAARAEAEQQAADARAQEQRLEEDRRRAEADRREEAEREAAARAEAEQQAADARAQEQRLEEDRRRAEAERRDVVEREAAAQAASGAARQRLLEGDNDTSVVLIPAANIPDQSIQYALIRLGYLKAGTADGKIGPASQTAIRAFQRSVGQSETGTLDDRQRVGLIESAAKAGDPVSQTTLGWMVAGGVGMAKNEADARRWFKTAADQGNADAAYNLGVLYRDGLGGSRSLSDARRYFEKARAAGNTKARSALDGLSDTP